MVSGGNTVRCEPRVDVDPRAWGSRMCTMRFFQSGVAGSDGMPGRLLGVLIRCLPNRLGHRGPWLYPSWLPRAQRAGSDAHEADDGLITEEALAEARLRYPMHTELTRRNKANPPIIVGKYFVAPGDPDFAVYTRGQGDPVTRQNLHDAWFQAQLNVETGRSPARPVYTRETGLDMRSSGDRRRVVAPFVPFVADL